MNRKCLWLSPKTCGVSVRKAKEVERLAALASVWIARAVLLTFLWYAVADAPRIISCGAEFSMLSCSFIKIHSARSSLFFCSRCAVPGLRTCHLDFLYTTEALVDAALQTSV
jgi:hypothetical protein